MQEEQARYYPISVENIYRAKIRLSGIAEHTPLMLNASLSEQYECNVYLKREDLQVVRSYKIRGAYNKMATMPRSLLEKGIVCASAGNHAQGVAFACFKMGVKGKIFMPTVAPSQKINKVKLFGKDQVEVVLVGDTYDDAYSEAIKDAEENGKTFIHPFNDERTIEGQGVVGLEILEDITVPIDYLFAPIGGGGLISGVGSFFRQMSPETKIIGVEPLGAPSMKESFKQGKVVKLQNIDPFVDGAAVQKVGDKNFRICQEVVDEITLVPEGKICTTILQLYNEEGIVVEPAGALSIAVLDFYRDRIVGKNVVCIISGGNNDITRTEEIKERSLLYEGLKHYFIIRFPQRPGALKEFLNNVLGPNDDITRFEYDKKNSKGAGASLVGIEVKQKEDYQLLLQRMKEHGVDFEELNNSPMLFDWFV
ncbi:MAG: threonine ammonia-lyase IlvA [Saprospiraceae bacterium]|nr:threonine ammonia-lyase IlvA [Saprospiraceae bacterium]